MTVAKLIQPTNKRRYAVNNAKHKFFTPSNSAGKGEARKEHDRSILNNRKGEQKTVRGIFCPMEKGSRPLASKESNTRIPNDI